MKRKKNAQLCKKLLFRCDYWGDVACFHREMFLSIEQRTYLCYL